MQTLNQIHSRSIRSRPQNLQLDTKNNIHFLAFCLSGAITIILDIFFKISPSWISNWIKWCPTSSESLKIAEREILSNLKRPYKGKHVNIGPCWEKQDNFIWTLKFDAIAPTHNTPLVLVHGFASGVGLWVANLDNLTTTRAVYAIDLLGFARSSRPNFSPDASEAEQQFVTGIEMWRKAMGLNKMILLGHDLGGFLITSYAMLHPSRVERLILVDPWGFPEKPISKSHKYELPTWVKFVNTFITNFNLLASLRAVGPLGPYFVDIFRRDLQRKYSMCLKNRSNITNYVYHCNSQLPSGEVGFKAMTDRSGWPLYPMINRIGFLDVTIPMIFIYGSRSWGNRQPALQIKYSRLNSHVEIEIIDNAGHHVYADQPEHFNNLVHKLCLKEES